jgi:hypothetical protein
MRIVLAGFFTRGIPLFINHFRTTSSNKFTFPEEIRVYELVSLLSIQSVFVRDVIWDCGTMSSEGKWTRVKNSY